MKKSDCKERMDELEVRLGALQREARAAELPVLIVFEGRDAAGKGTMINRLALALDARGFKVHPVNAPVKEERLRPFLWRFWNWTPARGSMAIYDRSWYGRVLVGRVDRLVKKAVWRRAYDEINAFERQLLDDGAVIIKFFLEISPREQKKRFEKLIANPATAWKVGKDDWKHHRQFDRYTEAVKDMIEKTGTPRAPWTVVQAGRRREAAVRIFETVIGAVQEGLQADHRAAAAALPARTVSRISGLDLSAALERPAYERRLKRLQRTLFDLEHEIYLHRIPVVIVYEGADAAGKGGCIRRMVQSFDPRGYSVIPVGPPDATETRHHYLWRFWREFPKAGHIAVFDRSWYGRVLVERVEGFCTEAGWKRAYAEINETERQWTDFGAVVVKFWLQISAEEQFRRFKAREAHPDKQWKITAEDWRNREKQNAYRSAVDDMLFYTGTEHAPWTLVASENKLHARIRTLSVLAERMEAAIHGK